jgi:hypothetical protein
MSLWAFPIKHDESSWTKTQTIENFSKFLKTRNGDGLIATMRAMDRIGCWQEALNQLNANPKPNYDLGDALLSFYTQYGPHIAESLKGRWSLLVDPLRRFLRPYTGPSMVVYRGELLARHKQSQYGISWTTSLDTAKMFANRREPDEGLGVVLEISAPSEAIISSPTKHSIYLGEHEFVIDNRFIEKVRVVD